MCRCLMWYEMVPTPRGWQFRYSVIFSNEDGGTATDRLMATWGRTTDIEFVYGVEVDDHDRSSRRNSRGRATRCRRSRAVTKAVIRCCGCRPTTTWSASRARRRCAMRRPGAIRPRQPVARSRDGSACLDLHRGGAGDEARGQDRGRRAAGIGQDSGSRAASCPSRRAPSSRMQPSRFRCERRTHGHGAMVRLRSRPQRIPHRAQRLFQGRGPAAGVGRTAGGGPVSRLSRRSTGRGAGVIAPSCLTRVNTVFTLDERYQPGWSLFSWTG